MSDEEPWSPFAKILVRREVIARRRVVMHPIPTGGSGIGPGTLADAAHGAAVVDVIDVAGVLDGGAQDDELLDDLADQAPVPRLGTGLAGDPRAVLARLTSPG